MAADHEPSPVRYEKEDADAKTILRIGLFLTVATLAAALAMIGLQRYLTGMEVRNDPAPRSLANRQVDRAPEGPPLQPNPPADLARFRRREEELLTTYGWIDQKAGVVRIPVADAMAILVQRGLPARPSAPPPPSRPPQDGSAPYPGGEK